MHWRVNLPNHNPKSYNSIPPQLFHIPEGYDLVILYFGDASNHRGESRLFGLDTHKNKGSSPSAIDDKPIQQKHPQPIKYPHHMLQDPSHLLQLQSTYSSIHNQSNINTTCSKIPDTCSSFNPPTQASTPLAPAISVHLLRSSSSHLRTT